MPKFGQNLVKNKFLISRPPFLGEKGEMKKKARTRIFHSRCNPLSVLMYFVLKSNFCYFIDREM